MNGTWTRRTACGAVVLLAATAASFAQQDPPPGGGGGGEEPEWGPWITEKLYLVKGAHRKSAGVHYGASSVEEGGECQKVDACSINGVSTCTIEDGTVTITKQATNKQREELAVGAKVSFLNLGYTLDESSQTVTTKSYTYSWPSDCIIAPFPTGDGDHRLSECGSIACGQLFYLKRTIYSYLAHTYDLYLPKHKKKQYREDQSGNRQTRIINVPGSCGADPNGIRVEPFVKLRSPFWSLNANRYDGFERPWQEVMACMCDSTSDDCRGPDEENCGPGNPDGGGSAAQP